MLNRCYPKRLGDDFTKRPVARRLRRSHVRRLLACGAVGALCAAGVPSLQAAEYYVATDGNNTNPGTIDLPFASLDHAQQAAAPGDTVWIRGGVYDFNAGAGASPYGVLFNKSGLANARINYWAYQDETPVFDFFDYLPTERIRGFSVQASHLHFKGLEIRGVQQVITNVNESWAIRVEGSAGGHNNIFERLNLHHNEGPGLFIVNGGNNLVLNSDSHHNYDPDRGGENADGFGSHSNDDGNVFIGNRAWENSDDGYDFINSDGRVQLINSWAWRNGYVPDTNTAAGNGAGIKAGGYGLNSNTFPSPQDVPTNLIQGNLSFDNRVQGFYANHHPGGIDWINNTAFDNPRGFDLLNDVDVQNWPADHNLRNNIAYSNGQDLANANQALIDDQFNTWNPGLAAGAGDFVSLDPQSVDGPRQGDGSLPVIDFMRLKDGSGLIDAGQDVGNAFNGSAPDLGAFETEPVSQLIGDLDHDGDVDDADFGLAFAAFTGPGNGQSHEITLYPSADAKIVNDIPGSGQSSTDTFGSTSNIELRRLTNTRARQGVFSFDLSEVEGDLSGATLTFHFTQVNRSRSVGVYGIEDGAANEAFDEATVNYQNAPGFEGPFDDGNVHLSDDATLIALTSFTTTQNQLGDYIANTTVYLDSFLVADTNGVVTFAVMLDPISNGSALFLISTNESGDGSDAIRLTLPNGGLVQSAADFDGDGDVDDADFGIAFANFTGPGGPVNVPEPSTLALLCFVSILTRTRL